jgi:hypothetical protein
MKRPRPWLSKRACSFKSGGPNSRTLKHLPPFAPLASRRSIPIIPIAPAIFKLPNLRNSQWVQNSERAHRHGISTDMSAYTKTCGKFFRWLGNARGDRRFSLSFSRNYYITYGLATRTKPQALQQWLAVSFEAGIGCESQEVPTVTHLRRKMLEEFERRNYSPTTTRRYLRFVERFAQRFGKSPDKLSPGHIRT